jgi:hypothetical protein
VLLYLTAPLAAQEAWTWKDSTGGRREFDLRARGWIRCVSGVQSLLGVALIALSLLSYFGHPFD